MYSSWYGLRPPTFDMLVEVAGRHGVQVALHRDFDCPRLFWDLQHRPEPWFIGIPEQFGVLARAWALAHEVGHLVLHDGPACRDAYRMQEDEADAWASCALIPHPIRTVEAGALFLWENYQKFPANYKGVHSLARRIAHARVRTLEASA